MKFKYEIEIEVAHVIGKFAGRDEIGDAILPELENLYPSLSGIGADGSSEYEVVGVEVFEKEA